VLSNPAKKREYDLLRNQFGASAYSQFRKNYSEQDIFSGSDINHIFEEMARSFGIREGQTIRLTGMGREGKNGGRPGDLLLRVHVKKPLLKSIRNFLTGRRGGS